MSIGPDYSIRYSASVSGTVSTGGPGDVLIADATSGLFVLATAAARGVRRATGIALTPYVAGGTVSIQQSNQVDATTAGLGTGAASFVRVSAAGALERCVPAGADDVCGYVEADGTFHAAFGFLTAAMVAGGGGGGATLPIDLTSGVTNTLPVANGGTGSTNLTFPAGPATLVARTSTETLSNKTISGASNTLTVRLANDVSGTLPAANGGLGASASGYTGLVKMAAGVSSAATLVNADVSASAAIAVSKLAAGTNTYVLTTTGGVPVWAAPSGGGGLGTYVLSGTGYISIGPGGSTVPTTGALRLGGAGTNVPIITWYDGAADQALVTIDTVGNGISYGFDASPQTAIHGAGVLLYAATGSTYIYAAGAQAMTLSGTEVSTALPMVGMACPWGAVDGQVIIAVSTTSITLTSAQYNTKIQKFTGSPAATRTITYPAPADDAHAYMKIVWCQTSVSGITISIGSGLTVACTFNDAPHVLLFTTTGVVRIT
ncbi:MAG: hypothetical protein ABIR11_01040 [Candidatus Limnocylindrales bacterium]